MMFKVKERKSVAKLKREVWPVFSLYVRMKDCLRTTGSLSWGFCITCGKRYHIKLLQAGHFIPGRRNNNLFSEQGTHAQCYNCNINLKGNTLEYRRQIVRLYGEGADERLEAENRIVKQYKARELQELKQTYKRKIKELEKEG